MRTEYGEAAHIAFSGKSSWRRVWDLVPITTHDVAGIRSLDVRDGPAYEYWRVVLHGWLHDDTAFEIEAGYEVATGGEVWARYRVLDENEEQLAFFAASRDRAST